MHFFDHGSLKRRSGLYVKCALKLPRGLEFSPIGERLFWQVIIWQIMVDLQKYIQTLEHASEDFQILNTAP